MYYFSKGKLLKKIEVFKKGGKTWQFRLNFWYVSLPPIIENFENKSST